MLGDLVELGDGLVDLACAKIQIAERIRGVPVGRLIVDDRAVFGNGQIEPALAEQLLRFAQCSFAIEWHRSVALKTAGESQSIVSNSSGSAGGLNDRRCTAE